VAEQDLLSHSDVYGHILEAKPDLMLVLGGFHKAGHQRLSSEEFKFGVHEVMKSPAMRQLYTNTPISY
jgi:hypothetical protein